MEKNKQKLKIGIDAECLSHPRMDGIRRVVLEYVTHLQKVDQKNIYYLYSNRPLYNVEITNPNWYIKVLFSKREKKNFFYRFLYKIVKRSFYLTLILPFILKRDKIDVYIGFSTQFYPFFFFRKKKIKKIYQVYDVVWKLFPETMDRKNRWIMNLLSTRNMKRADLLISISEATKRDVQEKIGIKKPIEVIPLASDPRSFYPADIPTIEKVKKKYRIEQKYILSLCTLEPRKNLVTLMKAFHQLPNKYEHCLVLVGGVGWIGNDFFKHFEKYNNHNQIIITGYVDNEDLAPLYSGASFFVFPSLYEGFGLPVLEAMQCGAPVLVSRVSSLPEIVKEAGLYFDPSHPQELSQKMTLLLENPSLLTEMREKSLLRAKDFSWEKSAQRLLEIITS